MTKTDPGTLLLAVLENVGLGVAVIDEQGKIAFANKKALTMWGDYSVVRGASFVEWRSSYRFQDRDGRDIPTEKASMLRALAGESIEPQDFRVILPDGSVKWMHAVSERFSIFGITGVLVIVADETDQVLLRRSLEQFEQMERLAQLTRGLIHDLNNMLSVLSGNLHLALGDEGVPQKTRNRLQQMALALAKGTDLTKKLGRFSRDVKLQRQPFEINHAVTTALELTRPLFGNQVRVKLALDPNLPTVEGDVGEIERALVNLILNAIEAMPHGGEIMLSTELAKIEEPGQKPERSGCFVVVTVSDTGVGIPENLQHRVFEPFFTTKSKPQGSGLGLASVYGIVRQHQGEIKVQSVPGHGAKFTLYLPVGKPSPALLEEEEPASSHPGKW
jgi:PAS domain S-box-containing protein